MKEKKLDAAWKNLTKKYNLSTKQIAQFELYLDQLIAWNNKFNLTSITNSLEVLAYHFDDSLALSKFVSLKDLHVIADVGSGGGFPGLPLKILYPDLKLILIEVNGKKVEFLNHLAQVLDLKDVVVEQIDWRAFIREGQYPVDLFCARASLQVDELLRIFKPGCVYKNSKLVYWAAQSWQSAEYANLILAEHKYAVGNRERKLILFDPYGFDTISTKSLTMCGSGAGGSGLCEPGSGSGAGGAGVCEPGSDSGAGMCKPGAGVCEPGAGVCESASESGAGVCEASVGCENSGEKIVRKKS